MIALVMHQCNYMNSTTRSRKQSAKPAKGTAPGVHGRSQFDVPYDAAAVRRGLQAQIDIDLEPIVAELQFEFPQADAEHLRYVACEEVMKIMEFTARGLTGLEYFEKAARRATFRAAQNALYFIECHHRSRLPVTRER